jgi:hypothetical protein
MHLHENTTVKGTVMKFAVSLSLPGSWTMDDVDFSASFFVYTSDSLAFGKDEMIRVDENTYTVEVDTGELSSGVICYQVKVVLPDGRVEIAGGKTMELVVNGLR